MRARLRYTTILLVYYYAIRLYYYTIIVYYYTIILAVHNDTIIRLYCYTVILLYYNIILYVSFELQAALGVRRQASQQPGVPASSPTNTVILRSQLSSKVVWQQADPTLAGTYIPSLVLGV